jgi:hypothetical protein
MKTNWLVNEELISLRNSKVKIEKSAIQSSAQKEFLEYCDYRVRLLESMKSVLKRN